MSVGLNIASRPVNRIVAELGCDRWWLMIVKARSTRIEMVDWSLSKELEC
jgi:hypothetical protein